MVETLVSFVEVGMAFAIMILFSAVMNNKRHEDDTREVVRVPVRRDRRMRR